VTCKKIFSPPAQVNFQAILIGKMKTLLADLKPAGQFKIAVMSMTHLQKDNFDASVKTGKKRLRVIFNF
jgi:hypothetical protein